MRLRSLIPHAPGVAFIAATLGFGGGSVLAKVILGRGVNALELLPIRFLFAVVSLVALLAVAGRLRHLDTDTWRKGSLLGVINMAAPSILMTLGLEHLSASVTALLVGLIPLTTVAFAHLLIDGERMHRGLVPGFILALGGTGLLVEREGGPGTNPALGLALVVLGVMAAGAGGALTRRFALRTPAAELVLPQFVAAAAVVLIAALASGSVEGIGRMDRGSFSLIVLLGTACTTLPFGALLWLSQLTTAARVALMAYLVPLVGVAGGVLILGEPLGWRLLGGGALILAGVVLADRSERRAHASARVLSQL
jgi:drug/metabolite transporter (DMT)-like permease